MLLSSLVCSVAILILNVIHFKVTEYTKKIMEEAYGKMEEAYGKSYYKIPSIPLLLFPIQTTVR